MLLPTLLSLGAFGLAAQAFVLPEVNDQLDSDQPDAIATLNVEPSTHLIKLDCSSCPYALRSDRNGVHEWTADVASDLEMSFDSEGNTLKFNGIPFYPITNPTLPPTLFVAQNKKDGEVSTMEGYHGNLRLSYSLEYDEKKFEDNTLVSVLMTVMGLDGQMVNVDNIEIKAIMDSEGKLTLHSTDIIPQSPDSPDAKCNSILCRVFTKLITGMNKAKASAKGATHKVKCFCIKCFQHLTGHKHMRPPHHKGLGMAGKPHRRPDGTVEVPSHVHFKPAGRPHHGHHGHHHRGFFSRMVMVLRTTVKVVFVPILIGVAFGMAASALGMLVGQAVVFLWLKFRRTGGEATYEPVDTDEKDAPPAYQDVRNVEPVSENEKEVDAKA